MIPFSVGMTGCDPFTIELEGDVRDIMNRVKSIAKSNKIALTGDDEDGTFDIDVVKGDYKVTGREIQITVSEKPYLVNCDHLQELLTDLFSGNDSRDYQQIFGYLNLKRL